MSTAAAATQGLLPDPVAGEAGTTDLAPFVRTGADGLHQLHLMVEGVRCGGCLQRIEAALGRCEGVETARLNLSTRRLALAWRGTVERGGELAGLVNRLGYRTAPFDPDRLAALDTRQEEELLRCLAVAGFAAANVMLLSVSVWAGHAQGMGPATRDLLHWLSGLIAMPAVAYAGQPFFRSALAALRSGRTNMDVPISVGVILTTAMSLSETIRGGPYAYFDSAVTLLFFLLAGRYLDRLARGRARSAAERLLALRVATVTVVDADGRRVVLPAELVRPGMAVLAAAGERIGVDGRVVAGASRIDTSLITGETLPAAVAAGDRVFAGTLNIEAPLRVEALAVGEATLLADIVRLMELAEQRRGRHVALADRMAGHYAPVVHGLALATFLGWMLLGGEGWQTALLHAVAILIITCPCALGLAVPAVQVIASARLLRQGVLLKSATALERLATVDTVVLDKTGTVTDGRPVLVNAAAIPADALTLAAALAGASRHPLAQAICRTALAGVPVAAGVREVAGSGLLLATPAGEIRLGRRGWAVPDDAGLEAGPELWLARPDTAPLRLAFADPLRADAAATVAALQARGLEVELLSGDRAPIVAEVAARLGIGRWRAAVTPAEKVAHLEALAAAGRRVLMVGDGLNDAPALAAAAVSVAPADAVDISQTAADAVFQSVRLAPVAELLDVAARVDRLVRQNFALALAYNAVAVPLAVMGLVTPLIAAVAMSSSSLLVVGNALRVARGRS